MQPAEPRSVLGRDTPDPLVTARVCVTLLAGDEPCLLLMGMLVGCPHDWLAIPLLGRRDHGNAARVVRSEASAGQRENFSGSKNELGQFVGSMGYESRQGDR